MFGRLLAPFRQTTGAARWILLTGLLITAIYVVLALLRAVDRPVRLRPARRRR